MNNCTKTDPDNFNFASTLNAPLTHTSEVSDSSEAPYRFKPRFLQFYKKPRRSEFVSMDGSTFLASLASSSGGAGAAAAKSPADVKASALIQFNSGILDSLPVQPGVKSITLIPSPSGK